MTHVAALLFVLLITCLPLVRADECVKNTESLLNDTAFVTAYEEMAAAVQADFSTSFDTFCSLGQGTIGCQVNLGAYSDGIEDLCTSNNGTIVTRDVELACSGQLDGTQIPAFEFDMFRIPICADETCDVENLPAELDVLFNEVVDDVVSQIENVGLECEAETMGGNGGDEVTMTSAGSKMMASFIAPVSLMVAWLSL